MQGVTKVYVPETYKLALSSRLWSYVSKDFRRQHILKSLNKILYDHGFFLVKKTIETSKGYVSSRIGTKRSRVSKDVDISKMVVCTFDIQPVFTPVFYDCTEYHGPILTKDGLVLPVTSIQKEQQEPRVMNIFFKPISSQCWLLMSDWVEDILNTGVMPNPLSSNYNDIVIDDAWVYTQSDNEKVVKLRIFYKDGIINAGEELRPQGSLILEMAGLTQQETVDAINTELKSGTKSVFTTQEGKMLSVVYELNDHKYVIVSSKADYDKSSGVHLNHTHEAVSQFLKSQKDERPICIQQHDKYGYKFVHFILA